MKLYLKFLSIHIKSEMQHKASFVLLTLGNFCMQFATFLGIFFMMSRFHEVDGFTSGQVMLCFAVVFMAFSLAEMVGRGFDHLPQMIANGEFDRALVRPKSALFQVIASRIHMVRLGATLMAALVLAWVIPNSGVIWTWDKIATLCLMIACGSMIFFTLFCIRATFAFFTTQGLEFMNVLTYGGRDHGKYPFSIYGREVLAFLTYVVPLALFQYYPLLYLLGMEDSVLYALAPLAGVVFVVPGWLFFRFGLGRYASVGS